MAARISVLTAGGGGPDLGELDRLIAAGESPMIVRSERLGGPSLSTAGLADLRGLRGRVLRALPGGFGVACSAVARRREYDVVLSWGELSAIPFALVLSVLPRRGVKHIAILMRPFDDSSPSRVRRAIKRFVLPIIARRGMDRLCIPAPQQRRRALAEWKIPESRTVPLAWAVDPDFWRPISVEQTTISSVGREMRDYETLLAALDGTGIPCHVAAGTGVLNPAGGAADARARNASGDAVPDGVTVGALTLAELRELYARSRFVVVPLVPTDSDNGVTAILEAMSMGRAVITTATEGRSEVLRDQENCILVPPSDAEALRRAMLELWDDPERCAALGAAGRQDVLADHSLTAWIEQLQRAADDLSSGPADAPRRA